jgi:hypothetical protein
LISLVARQEQHLSSASNTPWPGILTKAQNGRNPCDTTRDTSAETPQAMTFGATTHAAY